MGEVKREKPGSSHALRPRIGGEAGDAPGMADGCADGVRYGPGREFGHKVEAGFDFAGCEREERIAVEAGMGGRDRARDAGMGKVRDAAGFRLPQPGIGRDAADDGVTERIFR